jgi:hypothetical protein
MDAARWCWVVVSRRLPRGSLNDGLDPVSEAARISFSEARKWWVVIALLR